MFGIGFTELIVIAVVALVVVGPKRLPDVMKQAGRFFVQMRRTANDVRSTFETVVRDAEDEIRREEAAQRQALLTESRPVSSTPESPTAASTNPTPDSTSPSAAATAQTPDHLTPAGSRPQD